MCETLKADPQFQTSPTALQGIEDMQLLFKYLELFGVAEKVSFDLSLARGLDYYTGVIYEAVLQSGLDNVGVGSIAAGGRYDNLVGMFSGGKQIPCVGISIGVERIFAILNKNIDMKPNETSVYVCSIDGFLEERMKICRLLWDADVKTEFTFKVNPKLPRQLAQCEKSGISLAIIIGAEEVEKKLVKIKNLSMKTEVSVPLDQMVSSIKGILNDLKVQKSWIL